MERTFFAHETDFESLRLMIEEDSEMLRIDPEFTRSKANAGVNVPSEAFPQNRYDRYRELFAKLGLRRGVARDMKSGSVQYLAATRGMVSSGSTKGYIHLEGEISPTYESLDNNLPPLRAGFPAYKRIKGNWYIFVEAH